MTKELLKLKKDFWRNIEANMTDLEGQDVIQSALKDIKKGNVNIVFFLEDFWFCLVQRWLFPFEQFAEFHAEHILGERQFNLRLQQDQSFFDELQNPVNDGGLNY